MSERKTPGIQWEILLDGKPVTQYCYFKNNVSAFCVGTEAIDGPNILLNYLVITDFDSPLKNYLHGEKFVYGIDSFTLL